MLESVIVKVNLKTRNIKTTKKLSEEANRKWSMEIEWSRDR